MDVVGRARLLGFGIEAVNYGPFLAARQEFIDCHCFFQMSLAALLDVLCEFPGPGAHSEGRFPDRDPQIDHQVLSREAEDFIFQPAQPIQELLAARRRDARALVGEVRRDVAVGEHGATGCERGFQFPLCFQPVAGVEQCGKVRVHLVETAELAFQILRDCLSEKGGIAREAEGKIIDAGLMEGPGKKLDLGMLAGTVDAFDGEQFSARGHGSPSLARGRGRGNRPAQPEPACPHAKIRPMPADVPSIAAAVERVTERIGAAAARSGRPAKSVRLVAVTKTFRADAVGAAYAAGIRHFGENRVQEWEEKRAHAGALPEAVFHMIGHLQRNKARRAVALFHRIDSVDSAELARKLDQFAGDADRVMPVLIEVRLSEELAKSGIEPKSLLSLGRAIVDCRHLELRGLMTIPPWSEDPEAARPYFRGLRELCEGLSRRLGRPLPVLSMGMSHDFEIAVEEGATEVRIGTGIFGRRPAPGR